METPHGSYVPALELRWLTRFYGTKTPPAVEKP